MTDKLAIAQRLLGEGKLRVFINLRADGIKLPRHLFDDNATILDLRPVHTTDAHTVQLNAAGLTARLSFGGLPFNVVVPWTAVFCLDDAGADVNVFIMDAPHGSSPKQRRASFSVIEGGLEDGHQPTNTPPRAA